MIIAVSMRVVKNSSYYELRDAISHQWMTFFHRYGITPLLVPNLVEDLHSYLQTFQPQGVLLTGGNDLGDATHCEHPSPDVSPERDQTENELLKIAIQQNWAVLGVCRGLHLINQYFGGAVSRGLSIADQHVAVDHPVHVSAAPYGLSIIPTQVWTNSYHNQAVTQDQLGSQLRIFAQSDDQFVEGIYHSTLPIGAVQWHPERENPGARLDDTIVKGWLAKCA